MIRFSKLTDYASVILAIIAKKTPEKLSAAQLSEASYIPKPTCIKLLKLLVRSGVLSSTQGPQGGYTLAKPAREISVKKIVEAIEGPTAITKCGTNEALCRLTDHCSVMEGLRELNDQVNRLLTMTTLKDLVNPYTLNSQSESRIALLEVEK